MWSAAFFFPCSGISVFLFFFVSLFLYFCVYGIGGGGCGFVDGGQVAGCERVCKGVLENDIEEELGMPPGNKSKPYAALTHASYPTFIVPPNFEQKIRSAYDNTI